MSPITENVVDAHEVPATEPGSEPPVKKSKVDAEGEVSPGWPEHVMNISEAVVDEYASEPFKSLSTKPITVLNGIGEKSEAVASVLGVNTVADLATFKFYQMAKAIVTLAATETVGGRPVTSSLNADMAVVLDYEAKSLKEIADSPLSALQGISSESSDLLGELDVKTIRDLATWKYAAWAEAIVTLAEYEHEKNAAERRQETLLKRLE